MHVHKKYNTGRYSLSGVLYIRINFLLTTWNPMSVGPSSQKGLGTGTGGVVDVVTASMAVSKVKSPLYLVKVKVSCPVEFKPISPSAEMGDDHGQAVCYLEDGVLVALRHTCECIGIKGIVATCKGNNQLGRCNIYLCPKGSNALSLSVNVSLLEPPA